MFNSKGVSRRIDIRAPGSMATSAPLTSPCSNEPARITTAPVVVTLPTKLPPKSRDSALMSPWTLAPSATSAGPETPTLPTSLPSIRTPPLPLMRPVMRLAGPSMLSSVLWDITNAARTVVHGRHSVTQAGHSPCELPARVKIRLFLWAAPTRRARARPRPGAARALPPPNPRCARVGEATLDRDAPTGDRIPDERKSPRNFEFLSTGPPRQATFSDLHVAATRKRRADPWHAQQPIARRAMLPQLPRH